MAPEQPLNKAKSALWHWELPQDKCKFKGIGGSGTSSLLPPPGDTES